MYSKQLKNKRFKNVLFTTASKISQKLKINVTKLTRFPCRKLHSISKKLKMT